MTNLKKQSTGLISLDKLKKLNLDAKKIVSLYGEDVHFELYKSAEYSPLRPSDFIGWSYHYTTEESISRSYRGFSYSINFQINLDGSIVNKGVYCKIDNSEKVFYSEEEVLKSIDKLYSHIDKRYANAKNRLEESSINIKRKERNGQGIIERYDIDAEEGFCDLIDSLLFNSSTEIIEYKNSMLETIYSLLESNNPLTEINKQYFKKYFAKKYVEIYS